MKKFLKSVQLDRWTFGGLNDIGVVSHCHEDHDPTIQNCTFVPETIFVHDSHYRNVRNPARTSVRSVDPRRGRRIKGRVYGYPFLARDLKRALNIEAPDGYLHAAWWVFRKGSRTAVFIGELDAPEVEVMLKFIEKIKPEIVVLPSYGEMKFNVHRTQYPEELAEKIEKAAGELKKKGIEVWALPHPITPEWADEVAQRLC